MTTSLLKRENEKKRLDDYVVTGRYVIYICIVAELMILPQVQSMFYMVYAGAAPRLEACGVEKFDAALEDKEICNLYNEMQGNCTEPAMTYQFKSVNVEWHYICSLAKSVKTSISIQMLGVSVGSIVFGQLSDTFGRLKTMQLALIGMIISWIAVSMSQNLLQFTITRTINGFFSGGSVSVLNVFIVENVPKQHRMWINMVITWSPNIPPLAYLAYLAGSWDRLALLSGILCIPASVFCFFFIHESPRWLVTQGKVDEAREVIRKQLKASGQLDLMDEQFEDVLQSEYKLVQEVNKKGRQYSYIHLFCTWKLALTTMVISFSYFATSINNYGILFNMEKLSGSIYWNSVYTGVLRYACNLGFGIADLKFHCIGRKFIHNSGLIIIILALSLVVLTYAADLNHQMKMQVTLAILIANSMTSQIYISSGIVGNEMFPTPVRNVGYSFLQLWNRIGVIVSPFVFYLQDYWIALPYVAMLVLAIIDTFCFQFLLPETKGQPLTEHMPRKEDRIWGKRSQSNVDQLVNKDLLEVEKEDV